jgi:hypothetical protein
LKPTLRLGAVALVAACWLSAGSRPFVDALAGISHPADLARDYVTARARLEEGRGPSPDGEDGNRRAARYGAPEVALYGAPYYVHPPTATLAVLPLGGLPFGAAALVWAAASVVALGWLALSLFGIWRPDAPPKATHVALLMLGLAAWPPTLYCLEKGQWSIWVAALLAAGFRAFEAKRPRGAGALFGIAATLKVTPAVLIGFLLMRSRRAAAAMLAVTGCAALASLAILGPGAWRQLFAGSASNAAIWAPWLGNTASLDGIFARLLTSNPFTQPLVAAPALSRAAFGLSALALLAAAIWRTQRRRGAPGSDARLLAGWLTLPVLLNPLGWSHVVLLLLAPLTVLARDGSPRSRIVAGLLFSILTIPRQRLADWAGPIPLPAPAGLILGVHAMAAVALYAVLLADLSGPDRHSDRWRSPDQVSAPLPSA